MRQQGDMNRGYNHRQCDANNILVPVEEEGMRVLYGFGALLLLRRCGSIKLKNVYIYCSSILH